MMNEELVAHLRCRKCKHEWRTEPGPASCQKCGHEYVDWVNYDDWAAEHNGEITELPSMPETVDVNPYFTSDSKMKTKAEAELPFRIILDVDGPLAQFSEGVGRLYGMEPEELYAKWPPGEYAIEKAVGTDWTEMIDRLNAEGEDFWVGLEETPWAREFYEECLKIAPVYFATAPLPGLESAACWSGKFKWIQNFVGEEYSRNILIGHPKHLLASPGNILVDDGDHNVESFATGSCDGKSGARCILWPNVCNQKHERFRKLGDKVYLEILELIRYTVMLAPWRETVKSVVGLHDIIILEKIQGLLRRDLSPLE